MARLDLVERSENLKESMHWGSAFSLMEIVSVLFSGVMNGNDKFFLSKGHGAPGVYAILHQQGRMSDEEWGSYQADGSPLSELMEYNPKLGFCISGGSLGLAPSYAGGMALLWKKQNREGYIYVLTGDGELDEGSVWEAVISMSHYHLDNVTLMIDSNKLQSDGRTADTMNIPRVKDIFESFGWFVYEVDGHNCEQMVDVLKKKTMKDQPTAVICSTIKGRGVSFMEGDPKWHDRAMTTEEYQIAWNEVRKLASNR